MKKAKSILFRMNLKGQGVVNFDSNEQRFMWNQLKGKEHSMHENVIFAKKNWYNENGELFYKLKISSDCLRHEIFKKDVPFQSPNIANSQDLLLAFIASPALIMRGYLFAGKDLTIKKDGAISITDAEQTNNAVSSIETFSRSGKKTTDENQSDNSFFKKETVGEVKYSACGSINLRDLQFLSLDQIFDRLAVNPDLYPIYKSLLQTKIPSFNADPKYYQLKDSVNRISEFGVLFSEEDVVFMTQDFFVKLFDMNIRKSKAFANISKLEYKIIYDCTIDTMGDESGWNPISSTEDIKKISFSPEIFFEEENQEEAKKLREEIEAAEAKKKMKNKEEKEKKKAKKEVIQPKEETSPSTEPSKE